MANKSLILNEIKTHYGFVKDADFAKFLDITPQTLSNWKARNTFDVALVYTKCVEINPHWILTGEGEMIKRVIKNSFTPIGNIVVSDELLEHRVHTPMSKTTNVSPSTPKNVSPTVSPTNRSCQYCIEKERVIQQQHSNIETLKKLVAYLEKMVEPSEEREKKHVG